MSFLRSSRARRGGGAHHDEVEDRDRDDGEGADEAKLVVVLMLVRS